MFSSFSRMGRYQAQRFAQVTKSINVRAYSGNGRMNIDFMAIYKKGVIVFGASGFIFAIALTAAQAYDTRNFPKLRLENHVRLGYMRAISYPILYGIGWPIMVPSFLVIDICFRTMTAYDLLKKRNLI